MPDRQLTASRRAFALALLFLAALTGRAADAPYEALLAAARSLEQAGRLAEARQTDDLAIQLDPQRPEAFLHAGQVTLALRHLLPARNYLRDARRLASAEARPAIEALLAQVDRRTTQSMMTDGDERDFNTLLERVRSFRVDSTFLTGDTEFLTLYLRAKKLWLHYGQPNSLSYEPKTHLLMAEFVVRLGREGTGRTLVPLLQAAREEFPADTRPAVDRALALLATKGWTGAAKPAPEILSLPKGPRPVSGWVAKKFSALASQRELARIELRWVPPGTFRMLPANDDENREGNQVRITRGFWLGATEVTQAQWTAVMGDDKDPSSFRGVDFPVENVSWAEAMEFCRKLTEREAKLPDFPAGYEYRLPTEAEWEYAFWAGKDEGVANDIFEIAWCQGNGHGRTHYVAGLRANAWGFYDMIGNVSEWCYDYYSEFTGTTPPEEDFALLTPDLDFPTDHVVRGGSFATRVRDHPELGDDTGLPPTESSRDRGFRVALAPRIPAP